MPATASASATPWNVGTPTPSASTAHEAAGDARGLVYRQPEDGPRVQRELAEHLRSERDEARVVWSGRDLGEEHLVPAHEQLDSEHPPAAQRVRHQARDPPGLRERRVGHRLRLPRFAIVAIDLRVPDGVEVGGSSRVPHREPASIS